MLEKEVKALLRRHRITPKRSLGQNFLIHPSGFRLIIGAAELSADDRVLEIGAGLGTLTRALADSCGQVLALETDQRLKPALEEVLRNRDNVTLKYMDFLEADLAELPLRDPFKVVANIPYYITSAIMRKLMTGQIRPSLVALTVQKEVAERIVQGPGKMSLLAVSVQLFGHPEIVGKIPANAFYPAPKVDSGVLKIKMLTEDNFEPRLVERIFQLAKAGFNQKRKMLRNSLSAGLEIKPADAERLLLEAGLDPTSRPQELSIESWKTLAAKWGMRTA